MDRPADELPKSMAFSQARSAISSFSRSTSAVTAACHALPTTVCRLWGERFESTAWTSRSSAEMSRRSASPRLASGTRVDAGAERAARVDAGADVRRRPGASASDARSGADARRCGSSTSKLGGGGEAPSSGGLLSDARRGAAPRSAPTIGFAAPNVGPSSHSALSATFSITPFRSAARPPGT